jgi:hypothetical protein
VCSESLRMGQRPKLRFSLSHSQRKNPLIPPLCIFIQSTRENCLLCHSFFFSLLVMFTDMESFNTCSEWISSADTVYAAPECNRISFLWLINWLVGLKQGPSWPALRDQQRMKQRQKLEYNKKMRTKLIQMILSDVAPQKPQNLQ